MAERMFSEVSLGATPERETLRVDFTKKQVSGNLTCVQFTDADTNMIVVYLPALELSGYGDTREDAHALLKDNLDEWFAHLLKKTRNDAQNELAELGWVQDKFRSKDFSKAYVYSDGILQNLNAVEGSIQHMAMAV